jgi:G3E family GTPase
MSGLLLVTGYLGAGKTTFVKRLLLQYAGRRTEVIVNEFGRAGIDGALLTGADAAVTQIDNGSIFCSCRIEQFEDALRAAAARQPELIIVEASGLSDPVTIGAIISRVPGITYRSCVALADVKNLCKVIETARVCGRQLGVSSLIMLNKTDLASQAETDAAMRVLRDRYPLTPVYKTAQARFLEEWLETPATMPGIPEGAHTRDITLQKASITIKREMTSAQLTAFIRLFAEDTNRVKGIVSLADGLFLVDCVGAAVKVECMNGAAPGAENILNALAGPGLPMRKSIHVAVALYSALIEKVD